MRTLRADGRRLPTHVLLVAADLLLQHATVAATVGLMGGDGRGVDRDLDDKPQSASQPLHII